MNHRTTTTTGADVGEHGRGRIDHLKDSVKGFVEGAEHRAEAVKHRAIEVKNEAIVRGGALVGRAARTVRANPLAAVGIAFGLGYMGMRLFRR